MLNEHLQVIRLLRRAADFELLTTRHSSNELSKLRALSVSACVQWRAMQLRVVLMECSLSTFFYCLNLFFARLAIDYPRHLQRAAYVVDSPWDDAYR